jgi:arylsulfatase A-like enzyme
VDERLTLNIDVTATIAAVAGISPPNLDGVSLLDPAAREDVLLEWLGAPEAVNDPFYSPSAPNYSALRTAGRLYVEYDSEERELYDYYRDPHELDNLLADWAGHTPTAEAETLAQDFSARLDVLKTCAGVSCA